MAKLLRKKQLVFASGAGASQIGVFGSLAAAAPATTTDPDVVQSLANYLTGWYGAVVGGNSPAIEDMNALCFLFAYQLTYLFQAGVPEYNAEAIYYTGSIVNSGGDLYVSIADDNVGNALTDTTKWARKGANFVNKTANYTMSDYEDGVRGDTTGGGFTVTLPPISTTKGKHIWIKNRGTNLLTVKGNGSELIDDANTYTSMSSKNDALHLFNNGTTWDIL